MSAKRIIIVTISDLYQEANLYRKTRTLAESGFDVHLIAVKHPQLDRKLWQGVTLHLVPLHGKAMFLRIPEFIVKSLIRLFRLRGDLYISYDVYPLLPLRIKRMFQRIVYLYDSVELFPEVEALKSKPLRRRLWELYERVGIKKAESAFTVCRSDAAHLLKTYPALGEVSVVRNIPEYEERERSNYLRERFHIAPESKIGIYQGQIFKGRGLEQLIAAVVQVHGLILFIVGDGPLKDRLRRQSEELKAAEQVIFIDAVPFQELPRYTMSADVGFTLISGKGLSYYHALPNKLFEYIQAGIPVIGSNYPEIEAIIREEKIGYAVNPHSVEEIAQAVRNIISPENFRQFRLQTLSIREKYSWQKESVKYLRIIRSALNASE